MSVGAEPARAGRVARNLGTSWAAYVVSAVGLFLVTPEIIDALGKTTYGVWIILLTATSFSGLLDLGFRSAVIRYVSRHEAAGDKNGVRENATAGLLYFALVAALIVAIGGAAAVLVHYGTFDSVSPSLAGVVMVLAVAAALNLSTSFFRGLLYAQERIDLSNAISILGTLAKVTLILILVAADSGLYTLAWIELSCQLLLIGSMVLATLWIYGSLPFRLAAVRWRTWLEMWRYGGFTLGIQITTRLVEGAPPLLIGSLMGAARVPIFSIAASLANYLSEIVTKVGGVLTPSLSRMEGRGKLSDAVHLVLQANRLSAALASTLGIMLLGMARPFLHIWLGPDFDASYWLLVILLGGNVLGSAQMPTVAYFYATGTHDRLMWLSLLQAVLLVGLAAAGALTFGVFGVAGAVLIARLLPTLILRPILFCRLTDVSLRRFLADYYSALALFAAGATLAAIGSSWGLQLHSYLEVFLLGACWGGGYALIVWTVYLRAAERAALLQVAIAGLRLALPRWLREGGHAR